MNHHSHEENGASMRHQDEQRNANRAIDAAIVGIASASNTPFRTAFKITFGIAMGRLASALVFLSALALVISAYGLLK